MAQITDQEFILQISIPTLAPNTLMASPDLRRAAYVSRFRNGMCVVVDGVDGELFEGIGAGTVAFSSDSIGRRFEGKTVRRTRWKGGTAYDLTSKGPPQLSSNGEHLAYGVRTGDRWRIVIDGVEVGGYEWLGCLTMSLDGLRLAWIAGGSQGMFVVLDGVAGRPYHGILQDTLVFSPNSQEVAYGSALDGCLSSKFSCFAKSATYRNLTSGRLSHVNWAHDPASPGFSFLVRCLLPLPT